MLKIGDDRDQQAFPLELLECQACRLVQLSCIPDPNIVFPPDYPYSSGNSGELRAHFQDLASRLRVWPNDLVVDIGSNDGTFLRNLTCRKVGVDPTQQLMHEPDDISTYLTFFGRTVARQILKNHGPARYVTASNVLAHVEDPHDFLEGVKLLLAPNGVFITENGHVESIVAGAWDFVYHEHLRYYDPGTLAALLERHGLYVNCEQSIPVHGGSFRSWATTSPVLEGIGVTGGPVYRWAALRETVKRSKWYLRSAVSGAHAAGERVAAVGATARATTIIGYCELDERDIEAVYEVAGSDKIGRYMPGTRIPVVDEQQLFDNPPENVILLSWHLEDLIVPKLRQNGYEGTIIVPLPQLRQLKAAHA